MRWFSAMRDAIERWRTMRELRQFEVRDAQGDQYAFKHLMTEALEVLDRDLPNRAREIWEKAYAQFPDEALHSDLSLKLLLKLRLYDDAETIMIRGQKRYPTQARFAKGRAQIAFQRGDWRMALEHTKALRKKHPRDPAGYGLAAAALGRLGQAKEAEAMLQAGMKAAPEDIELRIEYAKLAELRKDWTTAMERWAYVQDVHQHAVGTVGVASCLKYLGRYDEAEALLNSRLHRFPLEFLVWIQFARISEHKEDWEEAVIRWGTVRKRFPRLPFGYLEGARLLARLGRGNEAEEVLREGMELIPDDAALLVEYASIAHARGAFDKAAERWSDLRTRFPNHSDGYKRGADALVALGRVAEAAEIRLKQPQIPG
jgi:predicted Zn-dependent protease